MIKTTQRHMESSGHEALSCCSAFTPRRATKQLQDMLVPRRLQGPWNILWSHACPNELRSIPNAETRATSMINRERLAHVEAHARSNLHGSVMDCLGFTEDLTAAQ